MRKVERRRVYLALVLKLVFSWFLSRILLKTMSFSSLQKAIMASFQWTLHFKVISSEIFFLKRHSLSNYG